MDYTVIYEMDDIIRIQRLSKTESETIYDMLVKAGLEKKAQYIFYGHPALVGEENEFSKNNSVVPMPIWKHNATAEERFMEYAHMAREKPYLFDKVTLVFQENDKNGSMFVRYNTLNCSTTEAVGLLQLGIYELILGAKGS